MNDLSHKQILKALQSAFWDYDIEPEELYNAITNPENDQYPFEKTKLFSRLLTGIEWYTLIKLVPRKKWKDMFSEETIKRIWPKSLQEKFTYAASQLL